MNDSKLLHFLKQFPAWLILSILFLVVLWLNIGTEKQFFERVIDTILGALMAILTGFRTPQTQVTAEKIQTGDIKPGDLENLSDGEIDQAVKTLELDKTGEQTK